MVNRVLALIGASVLALSSCSNRAADGVAPDAEINAVRYWDLPTGSRIAYRKFAAPRNDPHPNPIVFLHGGPGAYAVSIEQTTNVLAELIRDGFDVYVYDQVGGGLSERLEDITQYTVDRQVADLEAIRAELGADKLVLIGSSWGATLAGRYIAKHPQRVERAIFAGPGVLHPADWKEQGGYGRVDARFSADEMKQLQSLLQRDDLERAVGLLEKDPGAAYRTFPDAVGDALFDKVTNEFYLPHLGCGRARSSFTSRGYGFWANRMTGRDLDASESPLELLKRTKVPALILRGECEYMKREVAEQYAQVFQRSVLLDVPSAGHMIMWERPDEFLQAVRRFLRD